MSNEPMSFNKFSSIFIDEEKDQEAKQNKILKAVSNIPGDQLAEFLVKSFICGSLQAVKAIWELRGPFPVHFSVTPDDGTGKDLMAGIRMLNGKLFVNHNTPFFNCKTEAEMFELFEIAPQIGLGFMTGADGHLSELFSEDEFIRRLRKPTSEPFQGELPSLEMNGQVSHPELLDAMEHQRNQSAYPLAYRSLLCWVDKRIPDDQLVGIRPVSIQRDITVSIKPETLNSNEIWRGFALPQDVDALNTLMSKGPYVLRDIETDFSIRPDMSHHLENGSLTLKNPDYVDDLYLVSAQARPELQEAMGMRDGYHLCIADVASLSSKEKTPASKENKEEAEHFVRNHFPLGRICAAYSAENCLNYSEHFLDVGYKRSGVQLLERLADGSELSQILLNTVPHAIWEKLYADERTLDGRHYIGANKALGFDNKGKNIVVREKDTDLFMSSDITFIPKTYASIAWMLRVSSDTSLVCFESTPFQELDSNRTGPLGNKEQAVSTILDAGMWPLSSDSYSKTLNPPIPEDLLSAIKIASRHKELDSDPNKLALKITIARAGPEEAASVVKTLKQWETLKIVFGDEINRHLGKASRAVRSKLLKDDLGL